MVLITLLQIVRMVKTLKKSKHSNPKTLEYFKRDNKDQLDALFIRYVAHVMGTSFKMFQKSVCFKIKMAKKKFHGVRPLGYPEGEFITKTCVCLDSFHRRSMDSSDEPQVALIEGKIGRIDPSKLSKNVIPVPIDSSAETEHQFHCYMVIVDTEKKLFMYLIPGSKAMLARALWLECVTFDPDWSKTWLQSTEGTKNFTFREIRFGLLIVESELRNLQKNLGVKRKISYQSAFDWVKL